MQFLFRRHPYDDSLSLGHYLFVLKLAPDCTERFNAPDAKGKLRPTPLGEIVLDHLERLQDETLGLFFVERFSMQPDRISFLIDVVSHLMDKPPERYVRTFKTRVAREARAVLGLPLDKPLWEPPKRKK